MKIIPNLSARRAEAGDHVAVTMRAIRGLQKQLRELGDAYQRELAEPSATGTAHAELLRQLANQMQSIEQQIEALQQSIIQRQAVDTLRGNADRHGAKAPPVSPASEGDAVGRATPATPSAEAREREPRTPGPDPSHTVGIIIDTTA